MYTQKNYKTKREFLEDFYNGVEVKIFQCNGQLFDTKSPVVFIGGNPGTVPQERKTECLEGPHYPEPHKWYASVTIEGGKVVACKDKRPKPKAQKA